MLIPYRNFCSVSREKAKVNTTLGVDMEIFTDSTSSYDSRYLVRSSRPFRKRTKHPRQHPAFSVVAVTIQTTTLSRPLQRKEQEK